MATWLGRREMMVATGAGVAGVAAADESARHGPFRVRFSPAMRDDLRRRLRQVRWNDDIAGDWSQGTQRRFLIELVAHWAERYDFDAAERRLNAWPQQRTAVRNFSIHWTRVSGASASAVPLLLLNGWPSSFVEYRKLAPLLADNGFDVVMPALPGFGFSDRPARLGEIWPEDAFHDLMTGPLGFDRYLVSGTDIGAGVARRLALKYRHAVRGIHVAAVADPPPGRDQPPFTAAELRYRSAAAAWEAAEGAYEHEHYTKPQTVAFGLADSPVGLASWIVEKFHGWADLRNADGNVLDVFPPDMLLDTLTIYWSTGTIGSSVRAYYEDAHLRPAATAGDVVRVPTAVSVWPHDLARPPREWAARGYDLRQYTVHDRGGHFPAWEQPALYAGDLVAFRKRLDAGSE